MPYYHLLMNGQNFLVERDGKVAKHGFFQLCLVEADSPESAEEAATERMLTDEELVNTTCNTEEDPPMLALEEIHEVEDLSNKEGAETGRIWYPE